MYFQTWFIHLDLMLIYYFFIIRSMNKLFMLNKLPNSKDAKDDSAIKVRVIRLWNNHIYDQPDNIISKDMILMDEEVKYLILLL